MRRFLLSSSAAVALLCSSVSALAGGIPVIDISAIAQALTTYRETLTQTGVMNQSLSAELDQVQQGIQQIDQLQTQIGKMQEQINALTGSRDMAGILEGFEGMNDLLPASLAGAGGGAGGSFGGGDDASSERYSEIVDEDQPVAVEDFAGSDSETGGRIARTQVAARDSAYMALASAQATTEGMENVNAAYDALIAKIDQTSDAKASMDLLARISAENGRAITRLTQLLAVGMNADAAQYRAAAAERENDRRQGVTSEGLRAAAQNLR